MAPLHFNRLIAYASVAESECCEVPDHLADCFGVMVSETESEELDGGDGDVTSRRQPESAPSELRQNLLVDSQGACRWAVS